MQAVGSIITKTVTFDSDLAVFLGAIFVKTGEASYFPLFQWFIYPALGLLYAKYLRHVEDTDKLYLTLFGVSASLLLSFCAALYAFDVDVRMLFGLANETYYAQTYLHTFFALLCILLELSIAHFALKVIHLPKVGKAIGFMSGKLNQIYVVQWMLIGWMEFIVFRDSSTLPDALTVPVGIGLTVISTLLVFFYQSLRKKKKEAALADKSDAENGSG